MMGDCTISLLKDIEGTKESIRIFSDRVNGMPDDLILSEAESLVEDIKNMIEQKKIVKSNMKM